MIFTADADVLLLYLPAHYIGYEQGIGSGFQLAELYHEFIIRYRVGVDGQGAFPAVGQWIPLQTATE